MICYENFLRAFQNSCSARSDSRTFSRPDITVGLGRTAVSRERRLVLPIERESGFSLQNGPLPAVKSDGSSQNYGV